MFRFKLTLTVFVSICVLGACSKPDREYKELTTPELHAKVASDWVEIKRYDAGLKDVIEFARQRPDLFPRGKGKAPVELNAEQIHEQRLVLGALLDYLRALDAIKDYWAGYRRVGNNQEAEDFGFFISYTAWVVQYRHGLDFMTLTATSKHLETMLDEEQVDYEIPPKAFSRLKWHTINIEAMSRNRLYREHYKVNRKRIESPQCVAMSECIWAAKTVNLYHELIKKSLAAGSLKHFGAQTANIARDVSFAAWFPVQRGVSTWMGDTRVRHKHRAMVQSEQVTELHYQLRPGDVLVTRQNWYLSNIGLPGFWPHGAMFVGAPDELESYFDDPNVKRAVASQAAKTLGRQCQQTTDLESQEVDCGEMSLPEYLKAKYPSKWKKYTQSPTHVIEAVSEGVVFHPLSYTARVDYLGAMRPNQSKEDKAGAIIKAFELVGKPYDFNFDFLTDNSLVCTELVYKAWQTEANPTGLGIDLVKVVGRTTLPANDIVRQFDEQYEGAERKFEFVAFYDGREDQGAAQQGTLDEFRESWKRPKWDVAQK